MCETVRDVLPVEAANGFRIWACPECGLQFAGHSPSNFAYDRAYVEGHDTTGGVYASWLDEFAERQARGRHSSSLAAEHRAGLRWLERNTPRGLPVLDLGCGVGDFLSALRTAGYLPLGLDLASAPIARLRALGFCAAEGSIDDYPADWPPPTAVTIFHVLEHVSEPVAWLRKIRARFPNASLAVAVPSPRRFSLRKGKREAFDYPPHHLTRWTGKALDRALSSAGFGVVRVRSLPVDPQELSGSGLGCLLRGCLRAREAARPAALAGGETSRSSSILFSPKIILAKRALYGVPALYLRAMGWTGGSLMGFAEGTSGRHSSREASA